MKKLGKVINRGKYRMNEINLNYVCFDCRTTTRHNQWTDHTPTCPFCHKPMKNIGKKWRVPKKTDDKGWGKLRELTAN